MSQEENFLVTTTCRYFSFCQIFCKRVNCLVFSLMVQIFLYLSSSFFHFYHSIWWLSHEEASFGTSSFHFVSICEISLQSVKLLVWKLLLHLSLLVPIVLSSYLFSPSLRQLCFWKTSQATSTYLYFALWQTFSKLVNLFILSLKLLLHLFLFFKLFRCLFKLKTFSISSI